MVRMTAVNDLHSCDALHVLACPGCARDVRGEVGSIAVNLCCSACGADFWVRRSASLEEGWVQIRMMPAAQPGHYAVLGLASDVDDAAVKAAYRRQAFRWHPDRNGSTEASVARFRAISAAYAVLSDPQQRAVYDAETAALAGDWRRWSAVRVGSPGAAAVPLTGRGAAQARLRRLIWRCLAAGLLAGLLAGVVLPQGLRLLRPVLAGVALVGLVRLVWRVRTPPGS